MDTKKELWTQGEEASSKKETQKETADTHEPAATQTPQLPSLPTPSEAMVSYLLEAQCVKQGRVRGKCGEGCFVSPNNRVSIRYLNKQSILVAPL